MGEQQTRQQGAAHPNCLLSIFTSSLEEAQPNPAPPGRNQSKRGGTARGSSPAQLATSPSLAAFGGVSNTPFLPLIEQDPALCVGCTGVGVAGLAPTFWQGPLPLGRGLGLEVRSESGVGRELQREAGQGRSSSALSPADQLWPLGGHRPKQPPGGDTLSDSPSAPLTAPAPSPMASCFQIQALTCPWASASVCLSSSPLSKPSFP